MAGDSSSKKLPPEGYSASDLQYAVANTDLGFQLYQSGSIHAAARS